MNRENPHPIPPAFDDMRHLRKKTKQGYLIQHPLVHHRPPDKPGSTPATALETAPNGYTSTAELSARHGIPKPRLRRILRASLTPLWVKAHMLQRCWPSKPAAAILEKYKQRRTLPEAPPTGYITAAAARQHLRVSRTTLSNYSLRRILHPLQGRQRGSSGPAHFFLLSEVEHLAGTLRIKRQKALLQLQAKLTP